MFNLTLPFNYRVWSSPLIYTLAHSIFIASNNFCQFSAHASFPSSMDPSICVPDKTSHPCKQSALPTVSSLLADLNTGERQVEHTYGLMLGKLKPENGCWALDASDPTDDICLTSSTKILGGNRSIYICTYVDSYTGDYNLHRGTTPNAYYLFFCSHATCWTLFAFRTYVTYSNTFLCAYLH